MKTFFLFLLMNIAFCCTAIHIIDWERSIDRNQGDNGGTPPQKVNMTSGSCPCNKLLLSSVGPAATYLPAVMGTYTRAYTSYNNRDSYRQNYGSDYRLYFMPSGWLVGDNRGAPTGYVHNSDTSQMCPYMLQGGWMFYSKQHGSWWQDNTLVLRCITP